MAGWEQDVLLPVPSVDRADRAVASSLGVGLGQTVTARVWCCSCRYGYFPRSFQQHSLNSLMFWKTPWDFGQFRSEPGVPVGVHWGRVCLYCIAGGVISMCNRLFMMNRDNRLFWAA